MCPEKVFQEPGSGAVPTLNSQSIEQGRMSGPKLPSERAEEAGAGPDEKQATLLRVNRG